jgi:hypothetical protein
MRVELAQQVRQETVIVKLNFCPKAFLATVRGSDAAFIGRGGCGISQLRQTPSPD